MKTTDTLAARLDRITDNRKARSSNGENSLLDTPITEIPPAERFIILSRYFGISLESLLTATRDWVEGKGPLPDHITSLEGDAFADAFLKLIDSKAG